MSEKGKLRKQFIKLSGQCTTCFGNRKNQKQDIENCHAECNTYKQICEIRRVMESIKTGIDPCVLKKQTKRRIPKDTRRKEYERLKELDISDSQICKQLGIATSTLVRWKKEWGLVNAM